MSTHSDGPVAGPLSTGLIDAVERGLDVVALTADLAKYTDLEAFAARYPERFVNVGMAEQLLVSMAAGIARAGDGTRTVATSFASFLTRRAYDFSFMQVALAKANVILVGGVPGITQGFGPSHVSSDDLAMMRAIPGLTIVEPCDPVELGQAVGALLDHDGPVYLRKLFGHEPVVVDTEGYRFELGKVQTLRDGSDVTLFASGILVRAALEAARTLADQGIDAAVMNVSTIKPLDTETVLTCCEHTRAAVVAENHSTVGGLFSAVASAVVQAGVACTVQPVGLRDEFAAFGSPSYLARRHHLTAADVVDAAQRALALRDR